MCFFFGQKGESLTYSGSSLLIDLAREEAILYLLDLLLDFLEYVLFLKVYPREVKSKNLWLFGKSVFFIIVKLFLE